jgi:hypothetical protein
MLELDRTKNRMSHLAANLINCYLKPCNQEILNFTNTTIILEYSRICAHVLKLNSATVIGQKHSSNCSPRKYLKIYSISHNLTNLNDLF